MSSKPTVLFVDDESSVTEGIRTALRKAPFNVLTVNSGVEALDRLGEVPVDVIVSDERMPGMTGSQLLARVREDYPDTMRMILSGQADLQAAVRAINEGGIFRFLLKPCTAQDLASSVAEALEALERRRRFQRWEEEGSEQVENPAVAFERAIGAIDIAFQPVVHARPQDSSSSLFAFESIVRVDDPVITNAPQLFGLSEALGRAADVDTCIRAALADRIPSAPESLQFFVDIHPHSLLDSRIYDPEDVLAPYADRVVLALTERASLYDSRDLAPRIERLRDMGYRIALDDLGTGDSGLETFSLLQPDVVKFDVDLVRDLHECPTRELLVESMTAICEEMGILTVAEGLETREELEAALKAGCRLVAGHFLGKPAGGIMRPSA